MSDGDRIPTNLRTLLILEILGQSDRAMTATEINEQLGLPKQTVHRLCSTLEQEGFLTRQGNSRRFQPARRLRALGTGLLHSSQLHIARHQILIDVAKQVRETVNFVVPEAEGMSYLDRVETDWMFRIQLPVGTHVPFHCTASGKCYLASLDAKHFNDVADTIRFEPRTPNTISSKQQLQSEIQIVRERGYAIDNEELFKDMCALAVPVNDADGKFLAALAYHGPTQRLNVETLVDHLETMREGAAKLAELMR